MLSAPELKPVAQACIYGGGPAALSAPQTRVPLGKGHPFLHVAGAIESPRIAESP
jgi:hypothetical protein